MPGGQPAPYLAHRYLNHREVIGPTLDRHASTHLQRNEPGAAMISLSANSGC